MREWLTQIYGMSTVLKAGRTRSYGLSLAFVSCLCLLALFGCSNPPRVGDVLDSVAVLKGPPNDVVLKLAVSPDGKYAAAKLYDRKTIYVWDVGQGKLTHRLPLYDGGGVNFTPDGKSLYTGDSISVRDISLVINEKDARGHFLPYGGEKRYRKRKPEEQFKGYRWDLKTGGKVKTYFRENDAETWVCTLYDMRFNSDGSRYITRTNTGLHICDTATTKPLRFIPFPWLDANGVPRGRDSGRSYLGYPESFVLLPDWKMALVSAQRVYPAPTKERDAPRSYEAVLLWFDLSTGQVKREVTVTPRLATVLLGFGVGPLALSQDGHIVAIGSWYYGEGEKQDITRARVKVLDTRTGEALFEITWPSIQGGPSGMVFSHDGQMLFITSDRLTLWEIPSGRKLGEFKDSYAPRNSKQVGLSADGCTLAVGGDHTVIHVWSVRGCKRSTTTN